MRQCYCGRDVLRIQRVAAEELDVLLNLGEANSLWKYFSNRVCADWIHLPDSDSKLVEVLKELLQEYPDGHQFPC